MVVIILCSFVCALFTAAMSFISAPKLELKYVVLGSIFSFVLSFVGLYALFTI